MTRYSRSTAVGRWEQFTGRLAPDHVPSPRSLDEGRWGSTATLELAAHRESVEAFDMIRQITLQRRGIEPMRILHRHGSGKLFGSASSWCSRRLGNDRILESRRHDKTRQP